MARPVQLYTVTDSRNARLPLALLRLLGVPTHHDQGSYVVAARTKVAAAARLSEVMDRPHRPGELSLANLGGKDLSDLRSAGMLGLYHGNGQIDDKLDGVVYAWFGMARSDTALARFAPDSTTAEIVAHWRLERVAGRIGQVPRLIPAIVDPVLLPTTTVTVARPIGSDDLGKRYGGTRLNFPGGVATHSERDDALWIGGLGNLSRTRAEEMLRGLAGALAELDARAAKSGAQA